MKSPAHDLKVPHNPDAEMAVLGSMMLSRWAIDDVRAVIKKDDFFISAHRRIFEAIVRLHETLGAVDPLTVRDSLAKAGDLESVGGADYIHQLPEVVPSAKNAGEYAKLVLDEAILREMLAAGRQIPEIVEDPNLEIDQKMERAQQKVFNACQRRIGRDFTEIKDLGNRLSDQLDSMVASGQAIRGLQTGLTKFDEMTTGLYPGP
ncbi:MAG: hypothetical protein MH204_11415, partial [Fimbriimonadaceae bacterium]|nr:hypothetical protein [Fimbriimonadaceae bacterium]